MERLILHIEDNPAITDFMCDLFAQFFPRDRLLSRDTGVSAVNLYEHASRRNRAFNLIISDGNIRGVAGWDVITELTEVAPALPPVIAYVGELTEEARRCWNQAGVTEIIVKPADVGTLVAVIGRLLGD